MDDLLVQLGQAGGLSPETAHLVTAILAVLLIMVGATLLIVVLFGRWAHTVEQEVDTHLLPTLAEDVLDIDLQRIYRRTLELDALVDEHFEGLASATGTELGRSVRQFVVGLQAERFAAREDSRTQRGEPSQREARLDEVCAVLDEALERLGPRGAAPSSAAEAARTLEALEERLESRSRPAG